jgi:hypothetical protein
MFPPAASLDAKVSEVTLCGSGAAAQQEKHEQYGDGNPEHPQQDPTDLAFLSGQLLA